MQSPGRVLVTGATGFVGRAAADALAAAGHAVVRGARRLPDAPAPGGASVGYGQIGPATSWERALDDVAAIVHCAGLAHQREQSGPAIEAAFQRVNAEGTARLAEAAIARGVRRLVLVSSVAVNGSATRGQPFTEHDPPSPENAYARSKLEAELRLAELARAGSLEWVVLRPPMVYGSSAPGNYARLVKLVRLGLPLPLGAATAPRSVVGIANLASAVVRCIEHPAAANQTFLVADAERTSTVDLVHRMAAAMGRRLWTPRVPVPLLAAPLRLLGRGRDLQRLFEPLEIDISHIRTLLDWTPPVSLAQGVADSIAGRG
jgi:nucleoside-diphosphate-sugar epimerase